MIQHIMIDLDKPRKLRFGMAAMVEFEQLTGLKLLEIGDNISVETIAKMLWVMLKQEEKEITLVKTFKLVDNNADDMTYVITKVTEALSIALEKGKPKNVVTSTQKSAQ